MWKSSVFPRGNQARLTFNMLVSVLYIRKGKHLQQGVDCMLLTLARLMSSFCAAFTLSGFPPHARSTDAYTQHTNT